MAEVNACAYLTAVAVLQWIHRYGAQIKKTRAKGAKTASA